MMRWWPRSTTMVVFGQAGWVRFRRYNGNVDAFFRALSPELVNRKHSRKRRSVSCAKALDYGSNKRNSWVTDVALDLDGTLINSVYEHVRSSHLLRRAGHAELG